MSRVASAPHSPAERLGAAGLSAACWWWLQVAALRAGGTCVQHILFSHTIFSAPSTTRCPRLMVRTIPVFLSLHLSFSHSRHTSGYVPSFPRLTGMLAHGQTGPLASLSSGLLSALIYSHSAISPANNATKTTFILQFPTRLTAMFVLGFFWGKKRTWHLK